MDELADTATFLGAAARGAAEADVSVIIGTNRDEARAIVAGDGDAERASSAQVDAYLQATFDARSARRHRDRLAHLRPLDVLADAMTEAAFVRPSLEFAAQAEWAGAGVWAYQLDWAPAGSPFGACHCLELALVFDTSRACADAPILSGTAVDATRRDRVGAQMRAAWLSFARHGHPQPELRWPPYDADQRQLMVFGDS